jgi:hypothetical protein
VVVEAGYSALHKLDHVDGGWVADQLARLQARYHEVQLVFADSRRYAEDWTYRYLTTALADAGRGRRLSVDVSHAATPLRLGLLGLPGVGKRAVPAPEVLGVARNGREFVKRHRRAQGNRVRAAV